MLAPAEITPLVVKAANVACRAESTMVTPPTLYVPGTPIELNEPAALTLPLPSTWKLNGLEVWNAMAAPEAPD
jgi:hypothetical protein